MSNKLENIDISKMRKSTNETTKSNDLEKTKEITLNVINEVLGFSQKFQITIEKSEKYSLKLWALNTSTEIIS